MGWSSSRLVLEIAREFMARGRWPRCGVVYFVPRRGPVDVFVPQIGEKDDHDRQAELIHRAWHESGAVGAVGLYHAWSLKQDSLGDMLPRWKGRFDQHPDRTSTRLVVADHARWPHARAWHGDRPPHRSWRWEEFDDPQGVYLELFRCEGAA